MDAGRGQHRLDRIQQIGVAADQLDFGLLPVLDGLADLGPHLVGAGHGDHRTLVIE